MDTISVVNNVRRQLLGCVIPPHIRSKNYGIVINLQYREKAEILFKKKPEKNTINLPKSRLNFRFKPKELPSNEFINKEKNYKYKRDIEFITEKCKSLTKNEIIKKNLKKIRTIGLELRSLRPLPETKRNPRGTMKKSKTLINEAFETNFILNTICALQKKIEPKTLRKVPTSDSTIEYYSELSEGSISSDDSQCEIKE